MASPAPVKKVLVPIAAGSEPVEASVPIDILRRAGADVTVASAGVDGLLVEALYGVKIVADALVADCADASYDLIILPGGIPGAENLGGCTALEGIVRRHAEKGGLYSAICAAPPVALAPWGLLDGHKATAYPSFVEKFPPEVTAVDANVVVDGKVVTSRGPATAMEFALALVEQLYGKEKVEQIAKPMLVRYEPGYTIRELNPVQWQCSGTPKVLIPLANANEEMEVIMIIDALRRAKADVVVASVEDKVEIVARYGMRIVTDMVLDDAADQEFDLIIVPGGMPGAKTLSGKEKLIALLKKQAEANKPYGAICAATAQVLEPHGLLKGKKATTYTSMVGLLADASECENRVLVDGNLITSRSPGTAMEYAVAIVEKLISREAAREVLQGLLFV
ncbi:protein DJ-1 homolog B-like [Phragmites australis]|uniref:protein DJ-1 homolog B-like n=1 Tax=Phragmites australis TaxID=29695 RepID=UPI002D79A8E4|nr:protein DJ-1 homolog B-like [Phragmites australis]